ncbi:MAG TPA: chemotaxis protein CheB [Polyangiaceae bacterium]|nr:chemotaxis protein CheB [Polyangiaceae bacterium]
MAAPSLPSTPEVAPAAPFDVVALVASAGGLDAVSAVLRGLPRDLPAAVLVVQHLGGAASALVEILSRRCALPVAWADEGAPLAPGRVLVCPSRKRLEALPDGTCALHDHARGARDYPLDAFLFSLADSFGPRALAVVLTGMGRDGAAGARAVKQAGGVVLVQSEDTAEQPAMPRAAVEAGGADLVLPLHAIGAVVAELVAGGRLPPPRSELEAVEALFGGPGEARARLRAVDWASTPLGPVEGWSPSLQAITRTVLDTDFPMIVFWGREHVQIGNDAFAPSLGDKAQQGLPARVTWVELWDFLREQFEQIERTRRPIYREDQLFEPIRRGFREEAYFTFCYSPLYDGGAFAGVLSTSLETTGRVVAERRLATLRALGEALSGARTEAQAAAAAAAALGGGARDVPFCLLYLADGSPPRARLATAAGVEAGAPAAPRVLELRRGHPVWPLAHVLADGAALVVDDLAARLPGFHAGPWPEAPRAAFLAPLRPVADEPPAGVLVFGLSPRLAFDRAYRAFLELVAARVGAGLGDVRAREKERERLERLAELDRAKTEFFSNVSHEFRTPLTLVLGPLDELARRRAELPAGLAGEVEPAARNARRLLNLVNTLLDVSQIEAGRLRARFEPVDLAALTADVASLFRSAAERAGLSLRVDCATLPEPAWVDPGMWEKIVSNLLANALKFTFAGEIAVELRARPQHVELAVRDTGVGIPPDEQPHLFKRFHRVRGAKARTYEGSGIGLALVYELVRQHQGRVRVQSKEGEGTTFTVWLPRGRRPDGDEPAVDAPPPAKATALALAEEAARWADGGADAPASPAGEADDPLGPPEAAPLRARAPGARVLVVDDNADMRAYLTRLLAPHWQVEAAADGEAALAAMRLRPPDLVVADVMMPNLDGFGLLRAIRGDDALQATPVLLVTARAGEEAAIEGLLAGADDYLAKPFSAREFVARVGAQLALARVRRHAAELNAFLVRFSDAARALSDPSPIALTACRLLTELLGTERTLWADVDWATRDYVAAWVHPADGTPGEPSRWPLDPREPFAAEHLAGRSVAYDDAEGDPRIPGPAKAAMAARGIRAGIAVPVVVAGTLRAVLNTSQGAPRRWTPEEVASVEALAGRAWAEVERARAETALRASEERQAFMLKLSDALRPLADPIGVESEAARLLGEHLGAGRASYAEVEADGEHFAVHRDDTDGVPSYAGRYRLESFGLAFVGDLRAGRTVTLADAERDAQVSEAVRAVLAAGTSGAFIGVPLVKRGRLAAVFSLHHAAPHAWSADEVALVEETAERTWAAVERARAEKALRASEARFRALANTAPSVLYRMSPDWSVMNRFDGRGFLSDTPEAREAWLEAYIHPDDHPAVLAAIREAVREKRVFELEHRVRRADGTLGWTLSRAVPVLDEQGAIVEWVGQAIDVTAKKRAEAGRRRAGGELEARVGARTAELQASEERSRASERARYAPPAHAPRDRRRTPRSRKR